MSMTRTTSKRLAILAGLGLVGATGACSTISPDELDTGLASLREDMMREMQAGDESVSGQLGGRIGSVEARLAALESDLQQMEREFEVTIQRLEDELRFDVPVYFGFDEATLGTDDQRILDRFSSVAQKYYPQAIVTVEGFTDKSGSAEYNKQLGQRRAAAVKEYLVSASLLATEQVREVSYGEDTSRLVRPNDAGPGQAGWENRRVVLVIDHGGAIPAAMTSDGPTQ